MCRHLPAALLLALLAGPAAAQEGEPGFPPREGTEPFPDEEPGTPAPTPPPFGFAETPIPTPPPGLPTPAPPPFGAPETPAPTPLPFGFPVEQQTPQPSSPTPLPGGLPVEPTPQPTDVFGRPVTPEPPAGLPTPEPPAGLPTPEPSAGLTTPEPLAALTTPAPPVLPLNCGDSDVGRVFTECFDTPAGRKTQVVEFWKRHCVENGEVTLRDPITVPCETACADGWFYSADAGGQCAPCPAGTYSFAKGLKVDDWTTMPPGFITYCRPQPCEAWQLPNGTTKYIHSGDQERAGVRHNRISGKADETVESRLSFVVDIVEPEGWVWFEHRVESEWWYDGLYLFINGSLIKPTGHSQQQFIDSGLYYTWHHTNITGLHHGRHEFRLSYMKDKDQASPLGNRAGADRAFVRQIVIHGTRSATKTCTDCPLGKYSAAGSGQCENCPRNTHRGAAMEGDSCEPCADDEWALPGSADCEDKQPCDDADYIPTFGPCGADLQRQRHWELANPICRQEPGGEPESDSVPCGPCMPGFERGRDGTQVCQPCPDGAALGPDGCRECPPGEVAIKARIYTDLDALDGDLSKHGFTTACDSGAGCRLDPSSQSGLGGWEIRRWRDPEDEETPFVTVLSSGAGHGASVVSRLQTRITPYTTGYVDFEYFFSHRLHDLALDDVSAVFSVSDVEIDQMWKSDDAMQVELKKYYNMDKIGSLSRDMGNGKGYELKEGKTYNLEWTFQKRGVPEEVAINIRSLSLVGVPDGSAANCTKCPPGNKCSGGGSEPEPCTSGYYQSESGQTDCERCPPNSVTTDPGMSRCRVCGRGTVVNDEQTDCDSVCIFKDDLGGTVDLTPIGHNLYGPVLDLQDLLEKEHVGFGSATRDITREEADARSVHRYFIKLCEFVNDEEANRTCPEKRFGQDVDTAYVCQRISGDRAYSLGDWVDYVPLPGGGGVNVSFTGGDICRDVRNQPFERGANVTLRCDHAAAGSEMRFIGEDRCQYSFELATPFACPTCTEESYDYKDGECGADRLTQRTYFKRPEHVNCFGGEPKPEDEEVDCKRQCEDADWEQLWGECSLRGKQTLHWVVKPGAECQVQPGVTGPSNATGPLFTRVCSRGLEMKVGANKITITAVVVVCLVICLSLCLCMTVRERNHLRHEYDALARGRADAEDGDLSGQGGPSPQSPGQDVEMQGVE